MQQTEIPFNQELELFSIFLGTWDLEGHKGPMAPSGIGERITGLEEISFVSGNFFFQYKWYRNIAGKHQTGIAMIGREEPGGDLICHSFTGEDDTRTFKVQLRGRTLHLQGEKERAQIRVSSKEEFIINWERSPDGLKWLPLCELRGSKQGSEGWMN